MYLQLLLVCTIVAVAVGRSHKFCFIIWTIVKLFFRFSYNRLFTILFFSLNKYLLIRLVYICLLDTYYKCLMYMLMSEEYVCN